jgi:Ca2+-binding RTX toxin-like protein
MGPRRLVSIACSVALLMALVVAGAGGPASAGTTQVGPFSGPCPFAGTTADNVREVTVTLTVPDNAQVGDTFDADIHVEFDLPPAQIVVYDLEIVSEWIVTGPAAPSGPITVVTPGKDYVVGDPIVYDTVSVPMTTVAEGTIGFELTGAVYRFAFAPGGQQATADCTFDDLPVEVATVPVTAPALTCLGHTVTIAGTTGDDVIAGTNGPDVIHGVAGNNIIFGRGGDDIICGGPGDDIIFGGPGNDQIDGGGGFNIIIGGPGTDTCVNGLAILC